MATKRLVLGNIESATAHQSCEMGLKLDLKITSLLRQKVFMLLNVFIGVSFAMPKSYCGCLVVTKLDLKFEENLFMNSEDIGCACA